jgi:erythromycin esterase-like protein
VLADPLALLAHAPQRDLAVVALGETTHGNHRVMVRLDRPAEDNRGRHLWR